MAPELRHRTARTVEKGAYYPLGASLTPGGVNFALYSRHATDVFLLLFDTLAGEPTDLIQLRHRTRDIWHGRVEGLRPGQLYGYKVRGEYRPAWGLRFNEAKLLPDPYAKAVTGKFRNVDHPAARLRFPAGGAGRGTGPARQRGDRPEGHRRRRRLRLAGRCRPRPGARAAPHLRGAREGVHRAPLLGARFPGTYLGFIEKIPHLAGSA